MAAANGSDSNGIPDDVCEIYIIRHGETTWNREGRLQGQTESDLNDLGRAQAEATIPLLSSVSDPPFAAVLSSDLRRAADTAKIIAPSLQGNPPVVTTPELRERHLGVLEGLKRREAPTLQPQAFKGFASGDQHATIEGGGESRAQMSSRVTHAIASIAKQHAGRRVLLVSHGGVISALHRRVTGKEAARKVPNASLSVLHATADAADPRWRLLQWAGVEHLRGCGFDEAAFGGGGTSA